ncbi:MAG: hypothetical protein KDC56_07300, partial [Flavobacteriaceae bacterium]|nr:hypothetical protein [Flavobacteriaceae bacterium]
NNTLLTTLWLDEAQITTLDISANTLLTDVRLNDAPLTSAILDQLVIDLNDNGQPNGNLQLNGTAENLTFNSYTAYNNLVTNGWTIDVSSPPAPNTKTIVLTTNSTLATWSPEHIINTGATLKWSVSGGVTIPEVVADDPTLDLSGNTGVATITITSDEAFAYLTYLVFDGTADLTSIDATNATQLEAFNVRYSDITALDVSTMPNLIYLTARGNPNFAGPLDISNNTSLRTLLLDQTLLSSIDLSNNPELSLVLLNDAQFTSDVLDKAVIDLDKHVVLNGTLGVANNAGGLTALSYTAYNNLIAKGWTIDVAAPTVVAVSPKVFLQGPILAPTDAGLMNDILRAGGYLPTTSPYSDALTVDPTVFDAGGTSGTGLAADDIVDWVWVELRDKNDHTIVLDSRSALLQRDGPVVDLDGVSPLLMTGAADDYYVVVNHRNHLGIMSATTVALSATPTVVDLTTGYAAVFGGMGAVTEVSPGIFAMFGGDYNEDGQMNNTDLDGIYPLLGTAGYSNADMNMDIQNNFTDFDGIIYPNLGRGEQF